MKITERLARLDDRFGVPRTERGFWEWALRLWWVSVVVAVALSLLPLAAETAMALDLMAPRDTGWLVDPAIVGVAAFFGGFGYAKRLQQLGRESTLRALRPPVADRTSEP